MGNYIHDHKACGYFHGGNLLVAGSGLLRIGIRRAYLTMQNGSETNESYEEGFVKEIS
jgi:hypothetical protein